MEVIKINQLNKSFGNQKVLTNVSATINKGSVVALLGRNGAGKTTLLNLLNGSLDPDNGSISVLSQNPFTCPEAVRQSCVMVNEECHFYPWMTPQVLASTFSSMYKRWDQAAYDDLLKRLGLDASKKIAAMSKGSKRKLQLAFALAANPEILLLDEPIGGVDAVARDDILNSLIDSLVEKGVTIVLSSHELSDIAGVCDHVMILSQSQLIINSTKDDLLASTRKVVAKLEYPVEVLPEHPSILSCKANGNEVEIIMREFNESELEKMLANLKVKSFVTHSLTLQEIFKAVTREE